jgi:hypothetical protein
MPQLRRCPRLALEALHDRFAMKGVAAGALERVDVAEDAMPRLDDLANAALAEAVENDVGPQHQILPAAGQQPLELIGRQQALRQQLLRDGTRLQGPPLNLTL